MKLYSMITMLPMNMVRILAFLIWGIMLDLVLSARGLMNGWLFTGIGISGGLLYVWFSIKRNKSISGRSEKRCLIRPIYTCIYMFTIVGLANLADWRHAGNLYPAVIALRFDQLGFKDITMTAHETEELFVTIELQNILPYQSMLEFSGSSFGAETDQSLVKRLKKPKVAWTVSNVNENDLHRMWTTIEFPK